MKVYTKIAAAALVAVAALGIVSCNKATSGGGGKHPPHK